MIACYCTVPISDSFCVLSQYMIGDGLNRMDFTYVANVAQAHIDAAEKLAVNSPLAGKAYFITNQVQQRRFPQLLVCGE